MTMADNELERLISDDGKEKPDTEVQPKETEVDEQKKKTDEELQRKQEEAANLDKAIQSRQQRVRELREEERKLKHGDEEEIVDETGKPVTINDDDPSSKAWNKRIRETVTPVQRELEEDKKSILKSSMQDFLADHPALAKNQEKVEELLEHYDVLPKKNSGLDKEGVKKDLKRAFGAVYAEELEAAARGRRVNEAKAEQLFSDIAVEGGATSYRQNDEVEETVRVTEAERPFIEKTYGSVSEYQKLVREQRKKDSKSY